MAEKVKCEVCGKEFEMINPEYGCPYCHGNMESEDYNHNSVSSILKIVGWIILMIGFIGSIILGSSVHFDNSSDFNYAIMIVGCMSTGISSLVLFAFAEVIQILHDIRRK